MILPGTHCINSLSKLITNPSLTKKSYKIIKLHMWCHKLDIKKSFIMNKNSYHRHIEYTIDKPFFFIYFFVVLCIHYVLAYNPRLFQKYTY